MKDRRNSSLTTITRTPTETQWRKDAALALHYSGYPVEAEAFYFCGQPDKFSAYAVCSNDINHFAVPVLHTCHLRYCPECEKRAQIERMAKYMPAIEEVANFPKHGYSLKHLVLTTPYNLADESIIDAYRKAWNAVHATIEAVFYDVRRQYATDEEKRRKRISLKRHGIGLIVAAEFGERGHKLHFHCLIYSPFIPKNTIPKHWRHFTGGECEVTHIRKVNHAHEGAKEIICKYVTKFTELDARIVPCLHKVLFGTRRIRTYGVFYDISEKETERHVCCPVCDSGLKYMRRSDYEIATGRDVSTYVHTVEISPVKSGRDKVDKPALEPPEQAILEVLQYELWGFDAPMFQKRPKGHYQQD